MYMFSKMFSFIDDYKHYNCSNIITLFENTTYHIVKVLMYLVLNLQATIILWT